MLLGAWLGLGDTNPLIGLGSNGTMSAWSGGATGNCLNGPFYDLASSLNSKTYGQFARLALCGRWSGLSLVVQPAQA